MNDQTSNDSKETANLNGVNSDSEFVPDQTDETTKPVLLRQTQASNTSGSETLPTQEVVVFPRKLADMEPLTLPSAQESSGQDTQPIAVSKAKAFKEIGTTEHPESPLEPGEEIPDWLVRFASQENSATFEAEIPGRTQEVKTDVPFNESISEKIEYPSIEGTETILAASAAGWAEDTNIEVPSISEPANTGWQNEPPAPPLAVQEAIVDCQENNISEIRDSVDAVPSQIVPDASALHEGTPEPEKKAFPEFSEIQKNLESGQYQISAEQIRLIADDPEKRVSSLQSLRQYLSLEENNQVLWEVYAELLAKENQPDLAAKALATANQINLNHGGTNGTITGLG